MIQDVNSAFSPDQSVFKWLDQLRNDSTHPIGELWRRAVDRVHGGTTTRRPSLATRTWWWWWCRRLLTDLIWCYKIVFGLVVVNTNDLFEFSTVTQTRGHRYKLFKKSNNRNIRTTFFCERVIIIINTWNKLPADADLSSLSKFKRIITSMDFSDYLHCF